MAPQRILVLDPFPPMPDRNSGGRRLFEILKLLREEHHEVTFVPQHAVFPEYFPAMQRLGVRVDTGAAGQAIDQSTFRRLLAGRHFDTVVLCFYSLAKEFLPLCRELFPNARLIVDTVDLHFVRELRQAQISGDSTLLEKAQTTRIEELDTYRQADSLWAITPTEQDLLLQELPDADVSVVPNIHDVSPHVTPFSHRDGLLFVGNFWHTPNLEGVLWFCQEVLPIVRQQLPELTTRIVGNAAPEGLKQLAPLGVEVLGWVPNIDSLLSTSRLSIAPLLHGAGMKGKVGEALAAGLPVVTTSIGSEGMGLKHGHNVLVADNATAFASAIVLAYRNPDLWQMLAVNGVAHMEANYTPGAIRSALRRALTPAAQYLGIPDWSDASTVKRVVDAYIRRFEASGDESSLILGVVGGDMNAAAASLTTWIAELGHDISTIPDVELRPMTDADLRAADASMIWVPMSGRKPEQLTEVETFCPVDSVR